MKRGDLLPGDTVWLTPRTMTAPAVCYRQPRGAVVRLEWSHVVVSVAGEEHRVHKDNVRRTDPRRDEPAQAKPARRVQLPPGCEEVPLF